MWRGPQNLARPGAYFILIRLWLLCTSYQFHLSVKHDHKGFHFTFFNEREKTSIQPIFFQPNFFSNQYNYWTLLPNCFSIIVSYALWIRVKISLHNARREKKKYKKKIPTQVIRDLYTLFPTWCHSAERNVWRASPVTMEMTKIKTEDATGKKKMKRKKKATYTQWRYTISSIEKMYSL